MARLDLDLALAPNSAGWEQKERQPNHYMQASRQTTLPFGLATKFKITRFELARSRPAKREDLF